MRLASSTAAFSFGDGLLRLAAAETHRCARTAAEAAAIHPGVNLWVDESNNSGLLEITADLQGTNQMVTLNDEAVIDVAHLNPGDVVQISGGEPTIHPHFFTTNGNLNLNFAIFY